HVEPARAAEVIAQRPRANLIGGHTLRAVRLRKVIQVPGAEQERVSSRPWPGQGFVALDYAAHFMLLLWPPSTLRGHPATCGSTGNVGSRQPPSRRHSNVTGWPQ